MTRLFIALPIGGEIIGSLVPLHGFLGGHDHLLRPVAPSHYHITLKFLGECGSNQATAVQSTFDEINAPREEIPFTLAGMGVFPDIKKPGVLWVGLRTDTESINSLHRNVETYTRNFNFKEEKRAFTPHLTVARVKNGRRISGELLKYLESHRDTVFGESAFDRLALFSSRLTPEGPVYTELKSIRFR